MKGTRIAFVVVALGLGLLFAFSLQRIQSPELLAASIPSAVVDRVPMPDVDTPSREPREGGLASERSPGRISSIRWIPQPEPIAGKLIDSLASLSSASEAGDSESAYRLGVALRSCHGVPEDERALQTFLRGPNGVSAGASEIAVRNQFEFCEGVSRSTIDQWYSQLGRAAELGNPIAQVRFATERSPEQMRADMERSATVCKGEAYIASQSLNNAALDHYIKAFEYLNRAVESGFVDAYLPLANAYARGLGVNRDEVKALALLLVAQRQSERAGAPTTTLQMIIRGHQRYMRPAVREAAEAMATTLLSQAECCIFVTGATGSSNL